ncbi:MAG: hypothetical protein KBS83_03895 [Lachnospiraceae bacterium]|nr:hypothetical protein [Candidatus Equihabitans merdae]
MKKVKGLLKLLLIFFIILIVDYAFETRDHKWESGHVTIQGKEITLPISVTEFEKTTGITISDSDDMFRYIYFGDYDDKGECGASVQAYVVDNMVRGIKADNKTYNGTVDKGVEVFVQFPEGVNTGMTIKKIDKKYKTGWFQFYRRSSKEESVEYVSPDTKEIWFVNTFVKYSGSDYDIDIKEHRSKDKTTNRLGTTLEIFYYCK